MNPLWILAAAFGALTLKGGNPLGGGAPQGQATPTPFDPNLPPEIAAGVMGCASRCADPQQMLAFAAELAKQNFPVAAIFLQTRAGMLIQARAAQPPQLSAQPPSFSPPAQVQGAPQPAAPPPVPQAVARIQRTLTPEQNAKFEEFLQHEQMKAEGQANGSAPKAETPSSRKTIEVKERSA